ncbi:MAG TPA: SGNH hydrolase domain-containing protein [Acidimicrobiales bacterium]|nr:SGNH hydrolase domain-containing protein [Acidimicrobiales bacterium]
MTPTRRWLATRLGRPSGGAAGRGSVLVAASVVALASCGVALAIEPATGGAAPVSSRPAPGSIAAPGHFGPHRQPVDLPLTAPPPPPRHYDPRRPVFVMFSGDSVAQTAADGLGPLASRYGGAIANEGIMGCGMVTASPYRYFGQVQNLLPQCTTWQATWQAAVNRDHPDVVAVVVGRWELMDRVYNGGWTHVGDPAYDAYIESLLEQAIAIASSGGAKVALLTDPYFLRGHTPTGGIFPEDDPARVNLMNGLFRQVAARHPGLVSVIDFGAFLSPGGAFSMTVGGVQVRSDGVHMTPQAGAVLAPWLMPQLVAIGRTA